MKFSSFFLFGALLSFNAFAQQDAVTTLTLEQCIEYALTNGESVKIAAVEKQIAEAQIKEVRSDGLPQVNANVSVTNNIKIQTSFIQDFITPIVDPTAEVTEIPVNFGTRYNGSAAFTVRQMVFDGSFFVGLQAARTLRSLRSREAERTTVDTKELVSKAFYTVLITKEDLELQAKNFARLDSTLRETTLRYESGLSEKIEVSRLKIQHNNSRVSLKNTTELLQNNFNLLKFQMGMPLSQPLRLAGSLEDADLDPQLSIAQADFRNQADYKILKTNQQLNDWNIKDLRSQYLPNLYANFNLGWNSGTNTLGDQFEFNGRTWPRYTSLGFTLSVPIFDGLSKSSRITQSRLENLKLEEAIRQSENEFKQSTQNAFIDYQNALRDLKNQEENQQLAEDIYNVTRIKYLEGVGPNSEVIEADAALKESQTAYFNALFNAIIAKIDLQKALGEL